jgi:Chitobiase/beta-hexosaminidase C-terminal domain
LNAIAVATGHSNSAVGTAAYVINAASPTFSPVAGTYAGPQSVVLGDTISGSTIYFTVDGTTPTTSSFFYSTPIYVDSNTTIKAMAAATSYANSPVVSAAYTINPGSPTANPTFSPSGGTYTGTQSVILGDSTTHAVVYFTLDGSTPTTSSLTYSSPLNISSTTTIKAFALAPGYTASPVVSTTYTIE